MTLPSAGRARHRVGGDVIDGGRIAEDSPAAGASVSPRAAGPVRRGGDGRRQRSDCRESGTIDHPPSLG